MLSGMETAKDKVLRIILAGQPELNEKLNSQDLVQLTQRVRLRFHLTALTKTEMIGYIDHRLEVAGSQGRRIFAEDTYPIIYKYTGGVPRLINTLCDTCLMAAFALSQDFVSVETLDAAIRELQWTEHRPPAGAAPGPLVVTGPVHAGAGGVQPGVRPSTAMAGNAHAAGGAHAADSTLVSLPPHAEPSAAPGAQESQVVGRLLLACEGKTVMERELRPGRLVIGRTPDNDIQIDSKFISRHHCQILTQPDACVIEDLNSTNGIYVKSKRVRRHNLNDGDVVQVGQHEVMYIDERASRFKISGEHIDTEVIDQAET
jgi:hypothetical protein